MAMAVACVKCRKTLPVGEAIDTPKGFICKACKPDKKTFKIGGAVRN